MKEKKPTRKFKKDFKEYAVRLVVEGDKSSDVVRDSRINENILHIWKNKQ